MAHGKFYGFYFILLDLKSKSKKWCKAPEKKGEGWKVIFKDL